MTDNRPPFSLQAGSFKDWHAMTPESVLQALQSDGNRGLDEHEVQLRRNVFGQNALTPKKGKNPFLLFLLQIHQPLVYLLIAAAVVTAFLQEWVDSSVIAGVVLLNAIIGFIQESHALHAIESLAKKMNIRATVLRNGQKRDIPAVELVPGDMVFLTSGDKVPADLVLIKIRELQIDESSLTGESAPVAKKLTALAAETVLADRLNMAYFSTLVTYGTATGVVVETGDRSEIGRINRMMVTATELETPLMLRISQFSQWLLWVILGCAALTFLIGWLRGESALSMFMASVALAVGAIPEGLPAALTITLAIGVSRMAKRHAIVRKLPAVETLGSTTVICTDKTGTLTQNQMTVKTVAVSGVIFQASGSGYEPEGCFFLDGESITLDNHPALGECLKAGLLCNEARLYKTDDGWQIDGDPTEGALLVSAHKAGFDHAEVNGNHPRLDTLPFEAQHQFMATLHQNRSLDEQHIYLKGSVESIVTRCSNAFDEQLHVIPLDLNAIHRLVELLAGQGLRIIAFARRNSPGDEQSVGHDDLKEGLTFIGIQAMLDPPRPEAAASIASCQAAGIRVKMITGDHPGTARAIAINLGLLRPGRFHRLFNIPVQGHVMSGSELAGIAQEKYVDIVDAYDIYARISPEQKLRLVEALQLKGNIVAMTGDGVNDAPALRQANIGVAMGKSGTDVAKEAAAIVLTDDNFSTIEAAVEEGRGVFDNLEKFIAWTLPTNLGEGLVIAAAVFADVALPITPVQILWINMSTAVLLGLMLAFEPKEPGLMLRKPRSPTQPIFTRRLTLRIVLVGLMLLTCAFGLFEWHLAHSQSLQAARTVAVNMFVIGQVFYLFNCRSLTNSLFMVGVWSNRWLIVGVLLMIFAQLLLTYWSPMNQLFGTAPIETFEWLIIVALGLVIYLLIELEKGLFKRFSE
ncbi:MAG: cation-transporting P-type ATPase [Methylococcaceae bacterium]|nr:cation-transporting P-type ATPase [Methylococcaceae bacterium]